MVAQEKATLPDSEPWFATVAPSLMTREQYAALQRPFARSPEIELLVAVMADAVLLWVGYFARPDAKRLRDFEEAQRWFASDNAFGPFCFVNVCSALDLEPGAVRRALAGVRDAVSAGRWRTVRRGVGRRNFVARSAGAPTVAPRPQKRAQLHGDDTRCSVDDSSAQVRPRGAA